MREHRTGKRLVALGGALAALLLTTALTSASAAAAPGPTCLERYGRKVCGYDCKEAYGLIKCAKTPQGRCAVDHGRIKCFDPKGDGPRGVKAKATCVAAYGRTVCGYGCAKVAGRVRCSQVTGGRCWVDHGRLVCTEDKGLLRPPPGPGPAPGPGPTVECLSKFGRTLCGYDCKARFGQLACAKTPAGVCYAGQGRVTCWDPPRAVAGQRKARCVAKFGRVACGYHCVARSGQIGCAQTPQGVCKAAYGKVTCWDPPPPEPVKAPKTPTPPPPK